MWPTYNISMSEDDVRKMHAEQGRTSGSAEAVKESKRSATDGSGTRGGSSFTYNISMSEDDVRRLQAQGARARSKPG